MEYDYDLMVIGGGSAGYAAARTALEHGQTVAVADDAAELGGLCILRGCMPSKTLIYSAEVMHLAKHAEKFGLKIPQVAVDMPRLHARKTHWVNDFKEYRQQQLQSGKFNLFRERASFTDPETVVLQPSGKRVRAKAYLIATGSVVAKPPVPGLELHGIWNSDHVLELKQLPRSVIVLGAGVVACELAQFLHRIGSKVTQIQRSERILTNAASPEAADSLAAALREEGLDLRTGTTLQRIQRSPDGGFTVDFLHHGEPVRVSADHLFNALGRRPAVDGLGLEAARVDVRRGGHVLVDPLQRTSNPRIFAAGDVCGPYEIVHLAIMQGEVAARAAAGIATEPVRMDNCTSVTFTDPQVAAAGIPLSDCIASGIEPKVAEYPFADHGKSLLMEAPHGYVKVWADPASGRILGAECVGKDAGELIHSMAVAITLRATAADLLGVHWYHPTLSEIWSYPLEELVIV